MGPGPGPHIVRGKPNSQQRAKGNFLTLGHLGLGLGRKVPFVLYMFSLRTASEKYNKQINYCSLGVDKIGAPIILQT